MKELDSKIDEDLTLAAELIENDIRNGDAFRELQHYEKHKEFLKRHRIAIDFLQAQENINNIRNKVKECPEEVFKDIANNEANIRRYRSLLKKKRYKDDAERESWEKNLQRAIELRKTYSDTLKSMG